MGHHPGGGGGFGRGELARPDGWARRADDATRKARRASSRLDERLQASGGGSRGRPPSDLNGPASRNRSRFSSDSSFHRRFWGCGFLWVFFFPTPGSYHVAQDRVHIHHSDALCVFLPISFFLDGRVQEPLHRWVGKDELLFDVPEGGSKGGRHQSSASVARASIIETPASPLDARATKRTGDRTDVSLSFWGHRSQ